MSINTKATLYTFLFMTICAIVPWQFIKMCDFEKKGVIVKKTMTETYTYKGHTVSSFNDAIYIKIDGKTYKLDAFDYELHEYHIGQKVIINGSYLDDRKVINSEETERIRNCKRC